MIHSDIHSDVHSDDDEYENEHTKFMKCNNCGKFGHTIKQCTCPIRSYGIITYYIDENDDIWLLLIQRKYTYEFCDFIKGNFENVEQLKQLLKQFTNIELFLVFEYFKDDYKKMFITTTPRQTLNTKMFVKFESQFNKIIKPHIDIIHTYVNQLIYVIPRNTISEMLWEIPRGKKNHWEKPINCAMREFSEETGVNKKKLIHKKEINVVNEKIIGTNSIEYEFSYYVMKLKNKENVYVDSTLFEQHSEVRNVCWIKYGDALELFKRSFKERYDILLKLKDTLK